MITSRRGWVFVSCVLALVILILRPDFLCYDCSMVSADHLNALTWRMFMDKEWGGGKVLMYNAAAWAFVTGVALVLSPIPDLV